MSHSLVSVFQGNCTVHKPFILKLLIKSKAKSRKISIASYDFSYVDTLETYGLYNVLLKSVFVSPTGD